MDDDLQLLTRNQVAKLLHVSQGTVRNWAKGVDPRLPAVTFSHRCVRYRRTDVERLIKGATR